MTLLFSYLKKLFAKNILSETNNISDRRKQQRDFEINRRKINRREEILQDTKEYSSIANKNERLVHGLRYICDFNVNVICKNDNESIVLNANCKNISDSGALIEFEISDDFNIVTSSKIIILNFSVPSNMVPEISNHTFNLNAKIIRQNNLEIGFEFENSIKDCWLKNL